MYMNYEPIYILNKVLKLCRLPSEAIDKKNQNVIHISQNKKISDSRGH